MTAGSDHGSEDLRRFAREHHVRYDVVEEPAAATKQGAGAYELRLFATHGEDKLESPMCPRCVELTRELHSFATRVVEAVDGAGWAGVLEPPPVIYAAPDQHGPDAVSVAMHVLAVGPGGGTPRDGHVRALEEGLKALGIPRR